MSYQQEIVGGATFWRALYKGGNQKNTTATLQDITNLNISYSHIFNLMILKPVI